MREFALEARVAEVETKLEFMMSNLRGQAIVPTGVVDEKGQPLSRVVQATMLQMYEQSKAQREAGSSPALVTES